MTGSPDAKELLHTSWQHVVAWISGGSLVGALVALAVVVWILSRKGGRRR